MVRLRTTFVGLTLALALALRTVSAQPAIDIDTADAAALAASLPGIGPVKARRIVEHRERHGPFGTLEALEAVKGIGPVTLGRIRAHLAGTPIDAPGPKAPSGAGRDEGADGQAAIGAALSTTEAERATRNAVRAIVEAAGRDAASARASAAPFGVPQ